MPTEPPRPPFSEDEFRAALGAFATGVTIVTAIDAGGRPIGVTANSFNSVSLAPPLVLWSLSRQAGSMPAFAAGSHYAVSILAAEQKPLAERFSRRHADRFEGVPWRASPSGQPLIDGAVAWFDCLNRSRYEEGDHLIFVGEVLACERNAGSPLIFHGGRYYTELPLG